MIQGYEKHELRQHLAREDIPVARLAELYGVTPQTIYSFAKRNEAKITAIRDAFVKGLDTQFVGLWVVDKVKRIAEYENDVELINQSVGGESLDESSPALLRIKHNALKAVAEELGDLPTRATVDHSGNVEVKYNIVSPGDGV